jgi:hypothetical protein
VKQTAQLLLSPESASNPLISRTVELVARAEGEVVLQAGAIAAMLGEKAMKKNRRAKPESY